MDFSKFKGKVKQATAERKEKLLRGDYHVQSRTRKVISYASTVGKNIADDVTPHSRTSSQLFPFGQPQQQRQRSTQRRHHEEKRRKQHRSKRRSPREPYNPYPLI